ncbi:MAG: hypothetical protein ACLURP_08495 [Ruminococcus sp.]
MRRGHLRRRQKGPTTVDDAPIMMWKNSEQLDEGGCCWATHSDTLYSSGLPLCHTW